MNIKSDNKQNTKNRAVRQNRPPKKITETYLHNAGLYYLQRFAASAEQFKTVMRRKVFKSCRYHTEQDKEHCMALVDALVQKFKAAGLLNDDSYAQGAVNGLRRQGKSRNAITIKLKSKGLDENQVRKAMEHYDRDHNQDEQEAEYRAALTFARKKRLGPFGMGRETDYKKALAMFARAGFSFDTVRLILNMEQDDSEPPL